MQCITYVLLIYMKQNELNESYERKGLVFKLNMHCYRNSHYFWPEEGWPILYLGFKGVEGCLFCTALQRAGGGGVPILIKIVPSQLFSYFKLMNLLRMLPHSMGRFIHQMWMKWDVSQFYWVLSMIYLIYQWVTRPGNQTFQLPWPKWSIKITRLVWKAEAASDLEEAEKLLSHPRRGR